MLDTSGKLQSIEGVMIDICLKLGVTEAQHIHADTNDGRRQKLLKMTIAALRDLDGSGDNTALSMESGSLSAQDRAANALSHRMGVYSKPELR